MKAFFKALIIVPLIILAVLLSIANREWVPVTLNPLAFDPDIVSLRVPLFIVFFTGLTMGVVLGGLVVWFNQGHYRKLARLQRKELEALRLNESEKDEPSLMSKLHLS
jgi:uncharacterized integral membrane protein